MFSAVIRWAARRDVVDRTGSERRGWTLLAAGVFGAAGLLSAVVVSAGMVGLGLADGGYGGLPSITPTLLAGVVLWFAAPTIGAVTTATPAWAVLVEEFADGRGTGDGRWWWPTPALGGLSGAIGGILAHFVMWVILLVAYVAYDVLIRADGYVPSFGEVVGIGLLAGLFGVLFTGWITVPVLGAVGAKLGIARERHDLSELAEPSETSGDQRTRWNAPRESDARRRSTDGSRDDRRDEPGGRSTTVEKY